MDFSTLNKSKNFVCQIYTLQNSVTVASYILDTLIIRTSYISIVCENKTTSKKTLITFMPPPPILFQKLALNLFTLF